MNRLIHVTNLIIYSEHGFNLTPRLRTCLAYGITLLHEVYWKGIWKGVREDGNSLSIRFGYRYGFEYCLCLSIVCMDLGMCLEWGYIILISTSIQLSMNSKCTFIILYV